MKNSAMDLTKGRPIKQILVFSIPLVLGTLFQQLYSFVDTVMVGRFVGTDALAAVGATYSLNFLILGFVQGSCIGFAVPLGKAIGARDSIKFKRSFWNCCFLGILTFGILTAATILLTDPLLTLIQTPDDIFDMASSYIRIIFGGILVSAIYNYFAAVLRASGDSTRPFWFLLISSLLNIGLDYLFMVPFQMGVSGAAWATVISQFVSALLCLMWIILKTDLLRNSAGCQSIDGTEIRELAAVGYPMGFEYSVSAIGAVISQSALNTFGTITIAGQTAGEKIRQMFTLPMESVGMGMVTYVSQNDGAGRTDRIRQGIRAGLTIQLTYCAAAWVIIFFGKSLFTQFVLGSSTSAEAEYSIQYLTIISALFCFHGALMIFRNTLQGMGYSVHAILSGVGELIGRSFGSILAVTVLGFNGICLSNPLAWATALCYSAAMTMHFIKKREQAEIGK